MLISGIFNVQCVIGVLLDIIVIMVIFKYYFSGELIALS